MWGIISGAIGRTDGWDYFDFNGDDILLLPQPQIQPKRRDRVVLPVLCGPRLQALIQHCTSTISLGFGVKARARDSARTIRYWRGVTQVFLSEMGVSQ